MIYRSVMIFIVGAGHQKEVQLGKCIEGKTP